MVAPDWLACFAADERAALFDAYFESAPCAALLQTLITCGALALSPRQVIHFKHNGKVAFKLKCSSNGEKVEGTLLRNSQQNYNKSSCCCQEPT